MFKVYVLKSKEGKYYIGQTNNLDRRLEQHRSGDSIWTRKYKDWELAYVEEYPTRAAAMKREKQIKSYKGGNALKKLIAGS
ncbi:MAG: GIY-YIG nuclease family protein [Endomicrobiales bacterium]|nr:GIY-YIG nuclease family protein [Endomicrobiales bacterium]